MKALLISIGTISTPYQSLNECPFNVDDQSGALCELQLEEQFKPGTLRGLTLAIKSIFFTGCTMQTETMMTQTSHFKEENKTPMGTFALRSPSRPNPIGLAKLTIVEINDGNISVRGLDCLNGTHLIDIKPSITQ